MQLVWTYTVLWIVFCGSIYNVNGYLDKEFDVDFDVEEIIQQIGRHIRSPASGPGAKIDVNDFLIGVMENFRDDLKTGIPELKVPVLDPFAPDKPIYVDIAEPKVTLDGNFTDLKVTGLSGFVLESLDADLTNLVLKIKLQIPFIRATGNYFLKGLVVKFMPISGNGGFWVESHNLSLSAHASIVNSAKGRHLQLGHDFNVDVDFEEVQLDLENFLGGGRWTEILKKAMNQLSNDIFKKFLPVFQGEVNKGLLQVINKHLGKLPITAIVPGNSSANDYVDEVVHNVRNFIQENKYDPMILPDFKRNFTKKVMFVNITGEASLFDGYLTGISSLHRTDDCYVDSNKSVIVISANLGLTNLKLGYKAKMRFMSLGPSAEAELKTDKVDFFMQISQTNEKGDVPHLLVFEVTDMGTIWMDHRGMGPYSFITKWVTTLMMNTLKSKVKGKLSFTLATIIQKQLENVHFPL